MLWIKSWKDLRNYLYFNNDSGICMYCSEGKKPTTLKYMNSSMTMDKDLGTSCFPDSKVVHQWTTENYFYFSMDNVSVSSGRIQNRTIIFVFFTSLTICLRWACALWFLYFYYKAGLNLNCNFFNKFFHCQKFSIFSL